MPRTVLLAGATGLVGRECLRLLAADPDVVEVRAPVRRALPPEALSPTVRELVADFDRLDAHPEWFRVDQVVCALGTTIRDAGSKAAFRRVDLDYPVTIGRLAKEGGARHYLLVSAVGASARAWTFYNRVKGEAEDAIRALGFRSVTIARPSLLLGERAAPRRMEEIAKRLAFLTPPRFKPVHARQVAAALVAAARADLPGTRILENPELRAS